MVGMVTTESGFNDGDSVSPRRSIDSGIVIRIPTCLLHSDTTFNSDSNSEKRSSQKGDPDYNDNDHHDSSTTTNTGTNNNNNNNNNNNHTSKSLVSSSSSSSLSSFRHHHQDHNHNLSLNQYDSETSAKSPEHQESSLAKFTSCRWVTGYICCAARFAQAAIRQCIGMAIVCMTLSRKEVHESSLPSSSSSGDAGGFGLHHGGISSSVISHGDARGDQSAFFDNETVSSSDHNTAVNVPEFVWSPEFEALILNSFNIGFFLSPILGGHLSGRMGGKLVILVSLLVGSIATICLPIAAHFSDIFILVLRIVAGLFLGVIDPAIQTLWSRWAPKHEKARLTTVAFTGVSLAGIVTFFISAHLCGIHLLNGWPFIFYFFGGFAFLCTIPWIFLVYDSPQQHPRILDYEKELIAKGKKAEVGSKKLETPWRSMLTSGPLWAIVVSHATYSWVTSWMMFYMPKYLKDVMEFNVKEDGLYSSLPYVGRLFAGFLCGYLSDKLLQSGLVTTGQCRKIFQVIGCVGCAVSMLAVGFLNHTARASAVVLLILALFFQNFTSVAFRINHLDIAPRFAGVMMGMTLTGAMAFSLTGPPITAAIVKNGTQEEWLGVFIIVAVLNMIGAVVFLLFASGEVQPWALPPKQDDHPIMSVVVIGGIDSASLTKKEFERISDEKDTADDTITKQVGDNDSDEGSAPSQVQEESDKASDEENSENSSSEDGYSSFDTECGERHTVTSTAKTSCSSILPKRPLSHTTSMPVQYVDKIINKHNMLRKRISSTDLHQQNNEFNVRHNPTVSSMSPLSTHQDTDDEKKF